MVFTAPEDAKAKIPHKMGLPCLGCGVWPATSAHNVGKKIRILTISSAARAVALTTELIVRILILAKGQACSIYRFDYERSGFSGGDLKDRAKSKKTR